MIHRVESQNVALHLHHHPLQDRASGWLLHHPVYFSPLRIPLHLFELESQGLNNRHYTPSFQSFYLEQTPLWRFEQLNEILLYLDRDYDLSTMAGSEGAALLLQSFGYRLYQMAVSSINPVLVDAYSVPVHKQ